jgi:hypothetical protein
MLFAASKENNRNNQTDKKDYKRAHNQTDKNDDKRTHICGK